MERCGAGMINRYKRFAVEAVGLKKVRPEFLQDDLPRADMSTGWDVVDEKHSRVATFDYCRFDGVLRRFNEGFLRGANRTAR